MATREIPTSLWIPITPSRGFVVTNGDFPANVTSWAQQGSFPSGTYTNWTLQSTSGPTFNALALSSPQQIAVDSTGRILIADKGNGRLVRLNSSRAYLDSVTSLPNITGVAVDSTDAIYVAFYNTGTGVAEIRKYNSSLVQQWTATTTGGAPGGGTSLSAGAGHLACSATHLWIARGTGSNRVYKWGLDGSVVTTTISTMNGVTLSEPWGICVRGTEIYLFDRGNSRIVVFGDTSPYTFARQWTAAPSGALVASGGIYPDAAGNIWWADYDTDTLRRFSNTGTAQDTIPQTDPSGIFLSSGDVIWVNNATAGTVAQWSGTAYTRSAAFVWNNSVAVGIALGSLALTVTNGDIGANANVVNAKYFQINEREAVNVTASVRTTDANLTPRLQILFYDAALNLLSTVTETDWTPVANTNYRRGFAALVPKSATQYRVGLQAYVDAVPTTATVYLDDVKTGEPELFVSDIAMGQLKVEAQVPGRWV